MPTAKAIIDYLETLQVTQGRLAGDSLTVLPWQRRFIRGAWKPNVQNAALTIARGNGKSTLCAGIGSCSINGSLAVPRGETLIVAASFEQARIIFDHLRDFLGDVLDDKKRFRVWDTSSVARITDRGTGAMVRALGSDPRRAHGLAPSLVLLDEPAQWPSSTGERMLQAVLTAAGKQPHCKILAIGTKPHSDTHWFSRMLNGGADYAQVHVAREGDKITHKSTWKRANPSLSIMPDLEAAIRREANLAVKDASMLPGFKALRLNMGTADTEQSTLLDAGTWQQIESDNVDMQGRPVWGIDLGGSAASSAIAAFWQDSGRLETLAAFPREPDLYARGLNDGVGTLYQDCYERDEIITNGGAAVDIPDLICRARDRFGAPAAIAADRWREHELRDALKAAGLPVAKLELRGQGFKDGGEDVRMFRRACLEGRVHPLQSLFLTYAMSEARVAIDPAGNAKLAKNSEGGRRQRARDDTAAASILAVALAERTGKVSAGGYLGLV